MPIEEDILIFDLDEPFDSAPQIITRFKKAIKKNNIEIQKEISELIIGPPIKDTLEILIQSKDHDKIDLTSMILLNFMTINIVMTKLMMM